MNRKCWLPSPSTLAWDSGTVDRNVLRTNRCLVPSTVGTGLGTGLLGEWLGIRVGNGRCDGNGVYPIRLLHKPCQQTPGRHYRSCTLTPAIFDCWMITLTSNMWRNSGIEWEQDNDCSIKLDIYSACLIAPINNPCDSKGPPYTSMMAVARVHVCYTKTRQSLKFS